MSNLTSRVGRLITGSLNAAVDALEGASPTVLMEQSIREVESAITEVRSEHGKAVADRHLASKKLAENSGKHEELGKSVEVALANSREDLAETAISRQMDLETQVPILEATVAEASEREAELEHYTGALKAKRAEMQEELRAQITRIAEQPENTVIDAAGNPSAVHELNRKIDEASAAFDRASGHSADMLGSSASDASQMAELKALARSSEIEKRLADAMGKNS